MRANEVASSPHRFKGKEFMFPYGPDRRAGLQDHTRRLAGVISASAPQPRSW